MPALPAAESVFGAIACETRRVLLDALVKGEQSVTELVEVAGVSQSAVSQHLKLLKDAGLVDERRAGRFRFYRLNARPLVEVMRWVRNYESFWSDRLAALGRVLDEIEGRES
jgi:DNA-binding transcriptional ArsR family regulator